MMMASLVRETRGREKLETGLQQIRRAAIAKMIFEKSF
jgi:hypothetical protein